jgi:RNA polymerase sigma-70 factor (ECF subfamily)
MMDEEKTWLDSACRGDEQAFTRLVERYQQPVFNLCYRMLGTPMAAEDAAQETFMRAYIHLLSYDAGRSFSSWLLSIASHYCIDQLRRRHFHLISWEDLPPWSWVTDSAPEPEEVTLNRETEREVRALLDRLPPDYKAVVVLRYWYDLSYEEIARVLDTTVPAIKSRLFRARQTIAEARTYGEPAPIGRLTSRPGSVEVVKGC